MNIETTFPDDTDQLTQTAKILLVDTKPLYREGVRLACYSKRDVYKFHETGSIQVMVDLLGKAQRVDLAVVDHSLIAACHAKPLSALARRSGVRILYLADHLTDDVIDSARAAAGAGVVSKRLPLEQLGAIIDEVLSGGEIWPHTPPDPLRQPVDSTHFSTRQHEVYSLMRQGFSTKKIAYELGLTTSTIQHHISRILKNNNVRSRALLMCMESRENQ